MHLTPGTSIGPYQIVAAIGAGGMGEVYHAKDARLHREVAIKVLPEATAGITEALARFQREAEAVAAISHPNILSIFDVGREGSVSYLVTELLEGESLHTRLERSAVSWQQAADLGVNIASGLAAAHAKGIVHRDLKPGNIYLTNDGVVKILDFGLARVTPSAAPADHTLTLDTRPGMVLGTVSYMSPEQVRGQHVDARSDIFSFGCVLFEMVTGERAFRGATSADVTAAILTHEPPSIVHTKGGVAPELARIVARCLEKKPRRRFQSCDDLAFSLRSVQESSTHSRLIESTSGSSTSAGRPSIAVLPFANMSSDPENEYFSDGVAEEIINALGKLDDLRVAARSSAFSFKGKNAEATDVGRKLNVSTVLEGSVRKSGDRVRIMAQLIDVAEGYTLWSERYDRKMEDVFAVQDEIARAIVDQLKVKLISTADAALVERPTDNLEAYNLYLKGRFEWSKRTPAGFRAALKCYQRAIELDPNYAAPHTGIAESYGLAAYWGNMAPDEAFPKARQAAETALAIDESEAEALSSLAKIHTLYDLDWAAAEARFKKAIEIEPKNPHVQSSYGIYLTITHRDAESIEAHRRAYELDPLASYVSAHYGQALLLARHLDEAEEILRETIERDPSDYYPHNVLGGTYREKLTVTESLESYRTAVKLSDGDPAVMTFMGLTVYRFGDRDEAFRLFDRVREAAKHRHVWPSCFVLIHLIQNELDDAVRWLEVARDKHCAAFPWLNAVRRSCRTLNFPSDPRIDAILANAGIP